MDIDDYIAALDALGTGGANDLAAAMTTIAASTWVEVSRANSPRDTGQLILRTGIAEQGDTYAVIVVDVPYASEQEHGTRHIAGRGFFRDGEIAARAELGSFGHRYETTLAEIIESGGTANPRALLRSLGLTAGTPDADAALTAAPLAS